MGKTSFMLNLGVAHWSKREIESTAHSFRWRLQMRDRVRQYPLAIEAGYESEYITERRCTPELQDTGAEIARQRQIRLTGSELHVVDAVEPVNLRVP
jgi:hypothetical protein